MSTPILNSWRLLPRAVWVAAALLAFGAAPRAQEAVTPVLLPGRIIAVGLIGGSAVSPVGYLHPGNATYEAAVPATQTQSGRVLDPRRVLVASTSNYGAPRARNEDPEGAVLSIDPVGDQPVTIPADLGLRAGSDSAPDARVRLFTAQSRTYLNGLRAPNARTAAQSAVSNPLGMTMNNGTGRLWVANAPSGFGSVSIVDPAGGPIADQWNKRAGGVFLGDLTNRQPRQLIDGGLHGAAIATTMIGSSPDGSHQPVFAVLTAEGAVAQIHTAEGVDGLAPPGTVTPLQIPSPSDAPGALVTRAGMVLNWVPDRILYVTDPIRNSVLAIRLTDDGASFRVESVRRVEAPGMSAPIDIAPAVPEVANPGMSGSTTLAGGADFYVLNRGNGMILRMNQAGQTVASRQVVIAGETLGPRRLNGIAVSRDAQRLWLTVTGPLPGYPDTQGGLIEVAAFGPTRSAPLTPSQQSAQVQRGAELFQTAFTPDQGLGPLYNGTSCRECHQFPSLGGAGPDGLTVVYRVGRFNAGAYDPLLGGGGPVARQHSIGAGCKLLPGIPQLANLVSVRNTPSLFGDGVIDTIPDSVIRARAMAEAAEPNGVAGRPHLVRDSGGQERVGRFGWKADTAMLEQFIAEAMRNEMGLTTPLAPQDIVSVPPGCGLMASPKFDNTVTRALTAFVGSLPAPRPGNAAMNAEGAATFASLGCAACHVPTLPANGTDVPLYSDLLLHDMGPTLDDGVVQGQARGKDWRTTPLWGLGVRVRYLHDGRATSLAAAIAAHDGEGARSAAAFRRLTADLRERLLAFLGSL
jgi:CxxC motif-containing protein (DUF1111 family)